MLSSLSPTLGDQLTRRSPTTPPGYVSSSTTAAAQGRQASSTPSDESSLFELSFDYQVDEAGNVVRISKGSSSARSPHSSPPTPQDSPRDSDADIRPRTTNNILSEYAGTVKHTPSPVLAESDSPAARRGSLSRSESAYSALSSNHERLAPPPTSNAPLPRSLQRTASVPVSMTPGAASSTSTLSSTLSSRAQIPNGPRRTVERPPRVAIASLDYYELDGYGHKSSSPDEKENQNNLQGRLLSEEEPQSQGHARSRISGPTRVPSISSSSSISSGARALSDLVPVPQRHAVGRPIIPGPNRAGRVLKGAGFSGSKYPFDKIAEVEGAEGEGRDMHTGEETDPDDVVVPPASAPALQNGALARQRTYGLTAASASVAVQSLSQSGVRPRRSASLSDAAGQEPRISPPRRDYDGAGLSSRPVSSLGINGSSVGRARRVTLEERMKKERDIALEQEEYERREAELKEIDEIESLAYDMHARQSPSPTHVSHAGAAANARMRPTSGHQRRDSDTLRNLVPRRRSGSSSPPANSDAYPAPAPVHIRPAATPSVMSSARHRRSPTAPEPNTGSAALAPPPSGVISGKTWAAGDERDRELDREQDRGPSNGLQQQIAQQQQLSLHQVPVLEQSRPAPAPPAAASTVPDVRSKNIIVNKRAFARLDLIGKGGSSRVYRVMNHANEIYAIKRVSLDKTDTETMSGYMNEISLLKRLEGNARIIRLVDSEVRAGPGGSKGHLMLVMECGEIDLARLLQEQQKEPMNMIWISYYWQQMLEAVQVIHEEKIVHSDLKPANFVLVKGQLKLIDFGIANAIANDTTNIQRDHQIGTVNYMSPEAIELPDGMRRLKVGRPSDVWSLGCILYQMVYGQPPFHHLSVIQKMKAIPDLTHVIDFPDFSTRNGQPETSRRVRKDVIQCMKSCLCRNPKERSTIPELLKQDWLMMNEPESPSMKDMLAPDETLINPYYMAQLLQYGLKLGQTRSGDMSEEELRREAERLVAELKTLES